MSEYCVGFKSTPNLDNDPHDELEEERRELLDRLLQIESLLKYSEGKVLPYRQFRHFRSQSK